MKILLTNDDGIHSEGMSVLMDWAGRLGEIVVVAPKIEQSGKSHSIELHRDFEVKKLNLSGGVIGYSVDSTPADCVRFAILGLREQFDLVVSGVNRGLNIGRDIMYSGTVGAAFEAAALDVKSIAVSTEPESFESAVVYLPDVWQYIETTKLLKKAGILNINIPYAVNGKIRLTRQGGPYYSDDFPCVGNHMYRPNGKSVHRNMGDYTLDTDATLNGYITITPLSIDRTDQLVYQELSTEKERLVASVRAEIDEI